MSAMPRPPRSRLPSRRGRPRTAAVDAEDRGVVVEAALRLLEEEGPAALSMRRLAAEVRTSYQVVYTLFGDRAGLLDALFRQGFRDLAEHCRATAPDAAPVERFVELALAYRDFAHARPQLYSLMFGRGVQGFEPDAESRRVALRSFGMVLEAARGVLDAAGGSHRFADEAALARAAWSATHGHVMLELDSWFGPEPGSAERLAHTVGALARARRDRGGGEGPRLRPRDAPG